MRRADFQRGFTAHGDRIDRDDRGRARDARALHGAQAERTAADDGYARRGLDRHQRMRAVAPSPATATQLHAMPTSAAGLVVKIGTTHSSNVTISSAKPPMCEF